MGGGKGLVARFCFGQNLSRALCPLVVIAILTGCQPADSPPPTEAAASKEDTTKNSPEFPDSEVADVSACLSASDSMVDDASQDGWNTEVFSAAANKRLKEVVKQLFNDDPLEQLDMTPTSLPIRPISFDEEITRSSLAIRRATTSLEASELVSLSQALKSLLTVYGDFDEPHAKIKITRVALGEESASTTALVAIDARNDEKSVQSTATVECEWLVAGEGISASHPELQAIRTIEYEEVELHAGFWFREYTPSVMQGVEAYEKQLGYDCDYWTKRVERTLGANFMGYQGVSVGDVNGDFLDDVYICQTGGTPNILLVQQPDGTVMDVSKEAGVDFLDSCRCSLFLDLDNDGDQDLVIASITGTLILENDGKAKFTLRQRFSPAKLGYTLAAADYDNDGDVDVYACRYHPPADADFANPIPYHDANNGASNFLLENDGRFGFRDVTEQVGLSQNNTRWSYSAAWEDFDNDGDQDLYVANDFGRNSLYRNDQGKFSDVAAIANVEDTASGMSVSWGDFNHDGWPDVYVSNMFSSAGGRITYQRQFKPDATADTKEKIQRLARGNSLFKNNGDGTFEDVTYSANVEMGRWAWSSNFVDFDNDGLEDLLVANGNYTGTDSGDL